jgi:hypothetical protein
MLGRRKLHERLSHTGCRTLPLSIAEKINLGAEFGGAEFGVRNLEAASGGGEKGGVSDQLALGAYPVEP